mmetsp:Transcript_8467/g.21353  ORF Transcript_8467/g.21353 Transcript_8467/m.21353 type:complete len:207 (+) Transcript_8467:929-1549(+)
MDSGSSPDNPVFDSVSSSSLVSLPIQDGNLPLMPALPCRDSRTRLVMPDHASGILPSRWFDTSSPGSPKYSTSRLFILPMDLGSVPFRLLAEMSRCRRLTSLPIWLLRVPSMRLLDSTRDCSLVMPYSSSGMGPLNRLSDRSRYSSSSRRARAVRLNLPQHATLLRFIHTSVTRPPWHTTPCQPLAHGSPTPQLRCTDHRMPLHSS